MYIYQIIYIISYWLNIYVGRTGMEVICIFVIISYWLNIYIYIYLWGGGGTTHKPSSTLCEQLVQS